MELIDTGWIQSFSALHELGRRGELRGLDHAAYLRERAGMAHILLEMLRAMLEPGQRPRRSLRAAKALPIEVELNDRTRSWSARTVDVSAEGLGLQVGGDAMLSPGQEVGIVLGLPGGPPLRAHGRVMNVRSSVAGARCGVQLIELSARDVERLETLVFDVILERLRKG